MLKIKLVTKSKLRWTKENLFHIDKHKVKKQHVEEIFNDKNRILLKGKYYPNRYTLIGKCGKRILTVVLADDEQKFTIVTARDSSKEERVLYRENNKND